MPIGNSARVKPQGTETVGRPSILNGRVLRSVSSSFSRSVFGSARSAIVNGGTHAVGVIRRSTVSNTRETERRICSS